MEIKNIIQTLDWHPTRRWSNRSLSKIKKIIIHQELGESSIEDVNIYHINPNHISQKGCPHICYHYAIRGNYQDGDKDGEIVQVNELSSVTWHCKGQNSVSIGIMLQGNFDGPGNDLGIAEPSNGQMNSLSELSDYLLESFILSNQDIYGHYHYGKQACPGTHVAKWIEERRNEITLSDPSENIDKEQRTKEIQTKLNKLGYACGKIDGKIGVKTLKAIRKFQFDNQLTVDGIVGPQTWKRLISLTK